MAGGVALKAIAMVSWWMGVVTVGFAVVGCCGIQFVFLGGFGWFCTVDGLLALCTCRLFAGLA